MNNNNFVAKRITISADIAVRFDTNITTLELFDKEWSVDQNLYIEIIDMYCNQSIDKTSIIQYFFQKLKFMNSLTPITISILPFNATLNCKKIIYDSIKEQLLELKYKVVNITNKKSHLDADGWEALMIYKENIPYLRIECPDLKIEIETPLEKLGIVAMPTPDWIYFNEEIGVSNIPRNILMTKESAKEEYTDFVSKVRKVVEDN